MAYISCLPAYDERQCDEYGRIVKYTIHIHAHCISVPEFTPVTATTTDVYTDTLTRVFGTNKPNYSKRANIKPYKYTLIRIIIYLKNRKLLNHTIRVYL